MINTRVWPSNFATRHIDDSSPSFFSTVYWNPNVIIDPNGKTVVRFTTSDDVELT